MGESLVSQPGSCCPECVIDQSMCLMDGALKKSGDVWKSGKCQVCSCSRGEVTCYQPSCPLCPEGMVPMLNDNSDCCPLCQHITCSSHCSLCVSGNPEPLCTVCQKGFFRQSGMCVKECSKGTFQQGTECVPCHPSCSTCSDASNFHCTRCKESEVLHEGQCLSDCGRGFYASGGRCHPCHASCSECAGPGSDQCQVCPAKTFLHAGVCIEGCPRGYYAREQVCEKCEEECEVCGLGQCLRCRPSFFLEDGHCQEECSLGFYKSQDNTCLSCHPSCKTCNGARISSCTSCPHYLFLSGSYCLSVCPRGTYAEEGLCIPCHESCSHCLGKGHESCVECSQARQVVVVEGQEHTSGTCQDACPSTHQMQSNVCVAPPMGCEVWHVADQLHCQHCRAGWKQQRHSCVKECDPGFYYNPKKSVCTECDPRCKTCSGPGHRSCLTCHKRATLHPRKTGAECLTKCSRRHYLALDNTCQTCHPSCSVCALDHTNPTASICLRCKTDFRHTERDQCVQECSEGHFLNSNSDTCEKCHPHCATCNGPHVTSCLTCPEGTNLTTQGICEVIQCSSGFYLNQEGICSRCEGDCNTCSSDGFTCLTCHASQHLLYGKCVDQCPSMFFVDSNSDGECRECHWTCEKCLGPSVEDCLECREGTVQEGSSCLTECSSGLYQDGQKCRPCPGGCSLCNTSSTCLACHSPYLLQHGQCVTSCKPGTFANVFDNVCHECGSECEECSLFECLRCRLPHLLQGGQCVEHCSSNYLAESGVCHYNAVGPSLRLLGPLVAEYGKLSLLNDSVLHIMDADTSRDRLIVTLEELPSNGVLLRMVNGSSHKLKKNGSFTAAEMIESKIYYKYQTNQPLYGEMQLSVSDGHYKVGPEVISINVISFHSPRVVTNEPLLVFHGKAAPLSNKILKILDLDNPESVTIKLVDGPHHGQLSVAGEELVMFSLEELAQEQVIYSHDGSDKESDLVLLQASDEYNVVNLLLKVFIVDEGDTHPVLIRNLGAQVDMGGQVQISPQMLQASDIDSEDENLLFTLLPMLENSGQGKLALVIPLPAALDGFFNDGWTQMDETHLVRPTTSFTQRDVDEGRVWYLHSGDLMGGDGVSDQLLFSVADSSHPPNILADQTFIINVEPSSPGTEASPAPGTQLIATVQEGQALTLTPSHLSFSGMGPSEHLVYTITHPLGPLDGSLFHIDSPGLELRQFMQADISDMKIIYMPPFNDMGQEDKYFSFKFTVSDTMADGSNHLPEQKFTFHVVPQKGSQLSFAHPDPELIINSHETVVLQPELFELVSLSPEENVLFILLEAPLFGTITREAQGNSYLFTEEEGLDLIEMRQSRFLYNHDGSEATQDSMVFLALGHSSEASSRISITVRHHHTDNYRLLKSDNATLSLTLNEYESKVIGSSHLHFTDHRSRDEELVYTITFQPQFGSLVLTESPDVVRVLNKTNKFTQADIVWGHINYTSHTEIGPEEIEDQVSFNITDSGNNVLSNQVLRVTILSVDNSIPNVEVGGPVLVAEGGSMVVPATSIIALDLDTLPSKLEVVLDSQPIFGYLTNKDADNAVGSQGTAPLARFPLSALQDGSVWYIQSLHRDQEPDQDTFLFHVTDSKNDSPVERFNITIKPVNDEPPVVLGERVLVEKGQTIVIKNQSLSIFDTDSGAENLIISVEQVPQHGSLHRKKSASDSIKQSDRLVRGQYFTFQDILNGLILYSHDGSKYPEDVIQFLVSDGSHETGGIVEFEIVQERDMAPKLSISSSLTLRAGQMALVSQNLLKAEDADSDDENIKYVITRVPDSGSLEIHHLGSWVPLGVGSVFLQQDVQNGHIRFVHRNDARNDATDVLRFNLLDSEGNINLDQALHITVLEDHIPPRVVTNTGLTVLEDGSVPITHHLLSATDTEVAPAELQFSLVSGPTQGHLFMATSPEEAISSWSQETLETGGLLYRQQSEEEITSDHFVFTVSDGPNSISDTFHIIITPVDDQLPVLTTNVIKVQEGTRKVISEFEIQAADADTHDELLVVRMSELPQHGWLEVDGKQDARVFTMMELYSGAVSYVHDGSASSQDSFSVVVSDSTNSQYLQVGKQAPTSEPTTINVEVSKVEDGTPILRVNRGLHFLQQEAGTKGKNFITSHELLVEDKDTPPEKVQIIVTAGPTHGQLHLTSQKQPVSSFTQADITAGHIYYELTAPSHQVYSDQFSFEIRDDKSSVVPGNIFHIQWSLFVMGHKQYSVRETEKEINILVRKIGNLKQQSSVTCITHGGSARGRTKGTQQVDFTPVSNPLQFAEGEAEKYCVVPIQDDDIFEDSETFSVRLAEPSYGLLGRPRKSLITINDDEDKPLVMFDTSHFVVSETQGFIIAGMKRSGDTSVGVSVMCVSEDGTAIGSQPNHLANGTDFIHRLHDESSMVVFAPGITNSSCTVKIIDDHVFEMNEEFFLVLKDPSENTALGDHWRASVTIRGPNDESRIGFNPTEYIVSESEDTVSLRLERTGMDLSHTCSVWCTTGDSSQLEAQPSLDFVPHSEQVNFTAGQRSANCSIQLIDDKLNPKVEGREQFIVSLSTGQNASVSSSSSKAVVILTDKEDIPSIQFGAAEVTVRENQTMVRVPVIRSGDLSQKSYVRCSTRQRSAKANIDFIERPNTKDSVVTFHKGVSRMECEVSLIDDVIYEKEEKFIVKLSHPDSASVFRPHLGEDRVARVTIVDWEDRPRVSLEHGAYTTTQPPAVTPSVPFHIPIIRVGDSSQVLWVNVSTQDGSAMAGVDYEALSTQVEFVPGNARMELEVMLLHNPHNKAPRMFTLLLRPEDFTNTQLGTLISTSITVLPRVDGQGWILPAPPIVVSLPYYHSAADYVRKPASPGYPLVCVTPCEASYPGSNVTTEMCAEAGINVSSIQYSWEVAVPAEGGSGFTPFYSLSDDTNFANSHSKALESMFFARHFWVRCIATPTQGKGTHGIPLRSEAATIGSQNGVCETVMAPGLAGGLQGQSFKASLTYINASEEHHPNTIKVHIEIPHQDGMVPLISTLPIHNVRYLLTEEVYRTHHRCSNLDAAGGFLRSLQSPNSHEEYQGERESSSLQLYQHLDLKKCMWTFSAWFSMSELVDRCGGQVISDFQVGSSGQSFLTVRVPLYISRVHATSPPGWASLDHRTELSVSLYYNTLLWHRGPVTEPSLTARVQVTRMSLDDSGRLVIDITTQAKFRGQFVMQHPHLERYVSRLIPPAHLETQFSLELLWSASTWEGPEQTWRATSTYSLPDYTGEYKLELMACTAPPTQAYAVVDPPACMPHPPQAFPLPLAIQQSHRPVPLVYTLNTVFQLLNTPDLFLQDPREVDNLQKVDYLGSFGPGQTIYGRVLWHPSQDLHSAYQVYIQRVYLCAGADGYIPTYDPTGELYNEGPQYGCLKPSSTLKHRFLILDREQPYASEANLSLPGLKAHFARDLPEFSSLKQLSGVDGFLLDTDGLYQVNSGHQWYLQVLYTIGPHSERPRRETSLHSAITSTFSPELSYTSSERETITIELNKVPEEGTEELPTPSFLASLYTRNGTNMRSFQLESTSATAQNSIFLYVLYAVVALLVLLVIIIGIILIVKRFYNKSEKDKVIVVRSLKNEREEFRRRGETKALERPKTLPPNMTLNSESNLQTVKVKTLAITVRNNLEDEGTEV
ncbi:extracellular matrix organizing protein FRAS1-like isoform X2 [Scylla paramamosain]